MTSTTSSVKNKNAVLSMIISSIKNSGLLLVAYSFLLFIAFPVVVMLSKGNKTPDKFNYIDCGVFNGFSTFVITVFTVIFAVGMFIIYHNKRSVDLYASLPMKRENLFMSKYFAGLIMLIVPLVVFMIAGLVVSGNFSATAVGMTFYKMLGFILSIVNGYSMIALLAMLCGGVIDTLVSFAVVNISIAGTIYMATNLVAFILPGYNQASLYGLSLKTMLIMLLSPLAMTNIVGDFSFTKTPYYYDGVNALADEIIIMVLWAALAVGYFVAALKISKIRKNENVQSGFVFKFPMAITQAIASIGLGLNAGFVGVTSVGVTTVDTYQPTSGVKTLLMFMAGAFLGTLGAYLITSLVYNRGAKNFVKSLPVFAGSFGALAVFYLLISLGLVGGVMDVPEAAKVKSVSFNSPSFSNYTYRDIPAVISVGDTYQEISYASEDEQYIENVVALHQAVVDNLHKEMGTFFNIAWIDSPFSMSYEPSYLKIIYELDNGKKIFKYYNWYNYDYEDIKDQYNAILDTEVYKNNHKITKCDTAKEANVSMLSIRELKRYSNNPMYDTTLKVNTQEYIDRTEQFNEALAEKTGVEASDSDNVTSIGGVMFEEGVAIEDSEYYDSEFLNKLYTSLRKEFIADKNLSKTARASDPEYVDTDNVPDEVVYGVDMNYDMPAVKKSRALLEMDKAIKEKYDIPEDVAAEILIDSPENFIVTKDAYPETWKLINDYLQSNDKTSLFVFPNAA
ncbi:MAG: ABC transporter permease [Acutalibacteraceae bacterium]|nr:ABC transporter permease [Acutalibacteraceae bacterium]